MSRHAHHNCPLLILTTTVFCITSASNFLRENHGDGPTELVRTQKSRRRLVSAPTLDNRGMEFIVAYLPNIAKPNEAHLNPLELHLMANDSDTQVHVEYPVGTFLGLFDVSAGTVEIVPIPFAASQWTPDVIASNAVRAWSKREFAAFIANRYAFSTDAALALPLEVLNTRYIVMDYHGTSGADPAEFVIAAIDDDTEVTITPSSGTVGPHPANVPFTVTLDRGEGYLAQAEDGSSFAGSIIAATKPVTVTNGVRCAETPTSVDACDHVFEIAHPVQTWGREIAVADLPDRPSGSVYRILASEDATTVMLDGNFLVTLNEAEYHEVQLSGNHIVAGNRRIFVAQFMTGQASPGASFGDPSMGNMIPTRQYLQSHWFCTVELGLGGIPLTSHYAIIIAPAGSLVKLDGTFIPTSQFTPIGASGYATATLTLTPGAHKTSSKVRHGVYVTGVDSHDSYLYPAGVRFHKKSIFSALSVAEKKVFIGQTRKPEKMNVKENGFDGRAIP